MLFGLSVQSAVLGALLTFAPTPWYRAYADTTAPWGMTPLADQQLAGLIMWVPAGGVYLVVALWMLVMWIGSPTAILVSPAAAPVRDLGIVLVAAAVFSAVSPIPLG